MIAMNKIPMDQCVKGRVYKLQCRNLPYGVYDGEEGFIGIRQKFGQFYLFTEYHWDRGAPFGTVSGQEDLGIDVPASILIGENLGTYDHNTKRPLNYVDGLKSPRQIKSPGWWVYTDTNEPAPQEVKPIEDENKALFDFLKQVEVSRDGDGRWEQIRLRYEAGDPWAQLYGDPPDDDDL